MTNWPSNQFIRSLKWPRLNACMVITNPEQYLSDHPAAPVISYEVLPKNYIVLPIKIMNVHFQFFPFKTLNINYSKFLWSLYLHLLELPHWTTEPPLKQSLSHIGSTHLWLQMNWWHAMLRAHLPSSDTEDILAMLLLPPPLVYFDGIVSLTHFFFSSIPNIHHIAALPPLLLTLLWSYPLWSNGESSRKEEAREGFAASELRSIS